MRCGRSTLQSYDAAIEQIQGLLGLRVLGQTLELSHLQCYDVEEEALESLAGLAQLRGQGYRGGLRLLPPARGGRSAPGTRRWRWR